MTLKNSFNRRQFLQSGAALGAGAFSPFGFESLLASEAASEAALAPKFAAAKPVWATGREKEMNVMLAFIADVELPLAAELTLRVAGATVYRARVNGEVVGYGPARGPHGWFRVDEWDLSSALRGGANQVVIEIAGYNSNSYYLLDQPSFLQAEIVDKSGKVYAATSAGAAEGS
ncbi:MAG: twin-arginine translocation signal domain-containing protein, partial [Thermoguttaceae bacterium]|nr:twin-arginine translocation signal domain-containing protein [Thermoguttaceae bacterium]